MSTEHKIVWLMYSEFNGLWEVVSQQRTAAVNSSSAETLAFKVSTVKKRFSHVISA